MLHSEGKRIRRDRFPVSPEEVAPRRIREHSRLGILECFPGSLRIEVHGSPVLDRRQSVDEDVADRPVRRLEHEGA